jgi:RNA polymerase sigma factor (sigma-70 family)
MNFQEIYINHKKLVFNLALQYSQNTEDAEEITQDVFVKIHEKLDSFQNQSEIKTWIYRITVNQSLDYLKAKRSQKRWQLFSALRIDNNDKTFELPNFHHPGIELEQKESLELIFKCINQLPDNQKTALILLKIEQMSQAETADVMIMSSKAVESLFQRAKKNLEKLLNQNEGL